MLSKVKNLFFKQEQKEIQKEVSIDELKKYIKETLEKNSIFLWIKKDPLKRYSAFDDYETEVYKINNDTINKFSEILKIKDLELNKKKTFENNEYDITFSQKTIKWSITHIIKSVILIIEEENT